MNNNGTKEEARPGGMARRTSNEEFANKIIAPGLTPQEVFAACNFPDEESLNTAAQYISQLQMFHLDDEINQALLKLIGSKSINLMSLKYAVQAHGGLFWDSEASDKDKEHLAKMQKQGKRDDEDGGGGSGG